MFQLILCSHWSYVPTDPMFPLILCTHWFYVPSDSVFPLILCSHWFYVPTDSMFPLILCSHWSYVVISSNILPNSEHIVYDIAVAAYTIYQSHVRCKHKRKCKCKDLHVWAGETETQMQTRGEKHRFHRFPATTAQFKTRWRRRRLQFRQKSFWRVKGNFLYFSTKVYQT